LKPKRTESKDVDVDNNLIKPMSASEVSKENNCKTIQDLLKEENQLSEKNNIRVNYPRAKKEKINQNTDSLISTNGLVKIYDERRVVDGIDIKVKEREIVGLLGPNGAGKTTSFYMIVGLVRPDYGNVLFDSDDVTNLPMHIRARLGIGYLPQEESIFRKLTVYENIMAILETMNYSRAEMVDRCHSLMKRFGIDKLAGNKAITLSGGEKRRLTIARSLVSNPKLLMLDEPFSGVDPIAVGEIQEIVSQLREEGLSILITDHNVRETLGIVDRAYMIYEGKVLTQGTRDELVNNPEARKFYLGDQFRM
tara:strand:- start:141 stop:1064 length:924 start_codon:yes stop_codon:yes gene_type:complete